MLLAVGSSLADFALEEGGVGLSGVVYGLFALLWVIGKKDPRFAGAVGKGTVGWFAVWFFFCILATRMGWMRVANVAHGSGAILGLILAAAIVARGRARAAAIAGVVTFVLAGAVLASVGREYVNLAPPDAAREAYRGYVGAKQGRYEEAARRYRRAVELDGGKSIYWYGLGVTLQHLGQMNEAADAYRKAHELDPADMDSAKALSWSLGALGYNAHVAKNWGEAIRLYEESLSLDATQSTIWENLASAYESIGNEPNARGARGMAKQTSRPAEGHSRFPE